MKKLWILMAVLALACILAACGDSTVTSTTSETTVPKISTTAPVTTDTLTTNPPEGEKTEKTDDYTAVLDGAVWVDDSGIDASTFEFCGGGGEVAQRVSVKYKNRVWLLKNADGTVTDVNYADVKKMSLIGVTVKANGDKNEVYISEIAAKLQAEWKSVTARAGSYLMFDFTTNLPLDFMVTVTKDEGGSVTSALYKEDKIYLNEQANGAYTGIAKCSVPNEAGKTFYMNLCADNGKTVLKSIPVTTTAPKYDTEFSLIFQGDWELVKREDYLSDLVDLFYNVYPRLYARWGVGDPNVPKTISFVADKSYDGVAYCAGTIVCVSTNYANEQPYDIGFFSHEITHSVQQYAGKLNYDNGGTYNGVSYDAWWTENMASYGGFRYFHWGYSTKFIQFYDAEKFINWGDSYEGYGDGCQVFLSYLDWKFPTIDKNNNGKADPDELGVIDRINYVIKNTEVEFFDTPTNPNTPFNKAVYDATNGQFDCLDAVRAAYKEDIRSGAFRVTGFGDYKDNFITENIAGVPNPTYPKWEDVTPGDKTNTVNAQNGVTAPVLPTGDNLAKDAVVLEFSGEISDREGVKNAFDGKLDTMWRSGAKSAGDFKYQLQGYQHGFVIDLGAVKTFDTYVLVNAGLDKNDNFNTVSWEILVSEDGKTFTSVDYQANAANDVVTVNFGTQNARYVEMRVYKSDKSNSATLRLYDFMLFKEN